MKRPIVTLVRPERGRLGEAVGLDDAEDVAG